MAVKLEDITLVLRNRNPWESMDLGFALVRRNWKAIYGPWFALVVPFAALVYYFLSESPWIALLIVWWCKPFYDRIVLHVLSRAAFGNTPSAKDTVAAFFSFFKTGLIAHLSLFRLDFNRAFNLPVWQLEGLRGRKRRARQRVLQLRTWSYSLWLMITCMLLEILIYITLLGLIEMFTPQGYSFDYLPWDVLFNEGAPLWAKVFYALAHIGAISIIEPLYTSAGFTLYLNRRTQLEGWDIELNFRRMAARLQKLREGISPALAALVLSVALFGQAILAPPPALADTQTTQTPSEPRPPEQAKEVIKAVLAEQAFSTTRTEKEWHYTGKKKEQKNKDGTDFNPDINFLTRVAQIMAALFEALLWILLAIVIIVIIVYRDRWLHFFSRDKRLRGEYIPPEALFGMDVRPESLPSDIAGTARTMWQQGQHRMALSLLYRGALVILINRDKLELSQSHTEGDVQRLAQQALNTRAHHYLAQLTGAWQTIAYAHRQPADALALDLCAHWPDHFGTGTTP